MEQNIHTNELKPKSQTETHYQLSYDQWYAKSSLPFAKGSIRSLNEFRNYQLHVEAHSLSFKLQHEHKQDFEQLRLRSEQNANVRAYLDTSGTSFVFEPSPRVGYVQMTNQDITVVFSALQVLKDKQLALLDKGLMVCIVRYKTDRELNLIKRVLEKAQAK